MAMIERRFLSARLNLSSYKWIAALAVALCVFELSPAFAAKIIVVDLSPYGTAIYGVNAAGSATGYYSDVDGIHGFIRAADGTITTLDHSGSDQTMALSINRKGQVAGSWYDGQVNHGFLRTLKGTFVSFDINGSSDIDPWGLTSTGIIGGEYFDNNGSHGFVRNRDGTIATFDPHWHHYEPWLGPLKAALGPLADTYPAVPAD